MKEELSLLKQMISKMSDIIDNMSKKYESDNRVPTLDEYLAMHYDAHGSFPGYIKPKEQLIQEYEEKYGPIDKQFKSI